MERQSRGDRMAIDETRIEQQPANERKRVACVDCRAHVTIPAHAAGAYCHVCGQWCPRRLPDVA